METVVVNRPFETDLEAMVSFLPHHESREACRALCPATPGGPTWSTNVGLRLSAAADDRHRD